MKKPSLISHQGSASKFKNRTWISCDLEAVVLTIMLYGQWGKSINNLKNISLQLWYTSVKNLYPTTEDTSLINMKFKFLEVLSFPGNC